MGDSASDGERSSGTATPVLSRQQDTTSSALGSSPGRTSVENNVEDRYHSPSSSGQGEGGVGLSVRSLTRDILSRDAPGRGRQPVTPHAATTAAHGPALACIGERSPSAVGGVRASLVSDSSENLSRFATPEDGPSSVSPSASAGGESAGRGGIDLAILTPPSPSVSYAGTFLFLLLLRYQPAGSRASEKGGGVLRMVGFCLS